MMLTLIIIIWMPLIIIIMWIPLIIIMLMTLMIVMLMILIMIISMTLIILISMLSNAYILDFGRYTHPLYFRYITKSWPWRYLFLLSSQILLGNICTIFIAFRKKIRTSNSNTSEPSVAPTTSVLMLLPLLTDFQLVASLTVAYSSSLQSAGCIATSLLNLFAVRNPVHRDDCITLFRVFQA